MAKKNSTTLNSKNDITKVLKRLFADIVEDSLSVAFSEDIETIENHINNIKEEYYSYFEDNEELVSNQYVFIGFLDYILEAAYLYKINKKSSRECVLYVRDTLLSFMNKNNINLELSIITSRMASMITNILVVENEEQGDKIQHFCFLLETFSIYCILYVNKIKNFKIKGIWSSKGKFKFVYSSMPWISDKEFNLINVAFSNNNLELVRHEAITYSNVLADVFKAYTNNPEYIEFINIDDNTINGFIIIDNRNFKVPLWNERSNDFTVTFDQVKNAFKDRKYAIPKNGIYFDVIDKSLDIDHIVMKEDNNYIYLNIYIKSKEKVFYIDYDSVDKILNYPDEELRNNKPYSKELLQYGCKVDKNMLRKHNYSQAFFWNNSVLLPIVKNLTKHMMGLAYSCIYIAYCDFKQFTSIIRPYAIDKYTRIGYTRKQSYRIAYIRKLPKGYKSSSDARLKALNNGFDFIPTGYTYVSESNVELLDDKPKVIKI